MASRSSHRYFSKATFDFLAKLDDNNNRPWFNEHKQEYEDAVRSPALDFITDIGDELRAISPRFLAVPKKVGGSLMRVYRDVRFGKDKRPFKTNIGIQFRHFRGKDVHAPGFYLHVEPGNCFIGVGIWRPDGPALARIREAIADESKAWLKASRDKKFTKLFEIRGESLVTAPRGYAKDHPMIEDLRRKDFIAICNISDTKTRSTDVKTEVIKHYKTAVPYMKFLCQALELPF